MGAEDIKQIWEKKAKSLGYNVASTLLGSLFEKEFECYMVSFELCDSKGQTLDFFSFPIMPSEISIQENYPVNISNTFGGVSALSTDIYIPKTISLSGNFGRSFKMINRGNIKFFKGVEWERDYGTGEKDRKREISNTLKTGFGCIKVLQSILSRAYTSEEQNEGEFNKLYFYNLAFGESYLVKPMSFHTNQDLGNNAIWKYNLNLSTICPLYLDSAKKNKVRTVLKNVMQSGLNTLLNGAKSTLRAKDY